MIESTAKKRDGVKSQWFFRGPFAGLLSLAAFLYMFSLLLSRNLMPSSLLSECALLSVFMGGIAGGLTAAKIKREGVLTAGLLTGVIMLAVAVLVAILRPDGKVFSPETLKTAICAISGGTCGGVLCLRRPGSKKHKNKVPRSRR
jgi:putative membrane protein (TIGR04086 family)